MHGSLLTFGNDTPLYGHPTGGLARTDMCVIHTGYSHNTSPQNRWVRGGVGSGGEQPEQWKIWWREREELEGMSRQRGKGRGGVPFIHLFIHPHSSSPSLLLLFAALKSGGGGCTVGHNVVQYSEGGGGGWGSPHAILVKGLRETCETHKAAH